jgi:hypothetical protein
MKLEKQEHLKWIKISFLSFLVFFSFSETKSWDGLEDGNGSIYIYINPSENIEAGHTISFLEKKYGTNNPQKKKMTIEYISYDRYVGDIEKIYGYVDGKFRIFRVRF